MADAETQAVIDALEQEIREAVENVVVGAVERGVAYDQARQFIVDTVARLNGKPREERARVAWAIFRRGSEPLEECGIADARFYVGTRDGEPYLGVNARMKVNIEQIKFTATLAPLDEPLCKVCGQVLGSSEANHRPAGLLGLGSPTSEFGYFPHVFEPRDET